jgi:hypothetical protein
VYFKLFPVGENINEEFILVPYDPDDVEVEVLTLPDEKIEEVARRYIRENGINRIINLVRGIRDKLVREGYAVSEERIRKILKWVLGDEYYKYNY